MPNSGRFSDRSEESLDPPGTPPSAATAPLRGAAASLGELTTDRWATARREPPVFHVAPDYIKASPRVLPMVTPTDATATHFPRPDDGDRVTPEDAAATHFPPSGAPRRQAPDLEDQV